MSSEYKTRRDEYQITSFCGPLVPVGEQTYKGRLYLQISDAKGGFMCVPFERDLLVDFARDLLDMATAQGEKSDV